MWFHQRCILQFYKEVLANSHNFRFRSFCVLHMENLSNFCIALVWLVNFTNFWFNFWRDFADWPNCETLMCTGQPALGLAALRNPCCYGQVKFSYWVDFFNNKQSVKCIKVWKVFNFVSMYLSSSSINFTKSQSQILKLHKKINQSETHVRWNFLY